MAIVTGNDLNNVIIGQDEVIEQVLIALFVGGHCLITGLPGTAKTLLVRTVGQILGLDFRRIQFTPDLMPSDITGTDIIEEDPTTGRRTSTTAPSGVYFRRTSPGMSEKSRWCSVGCQIGPSVKVKPVASRSTPEPFSTSS